MSRQIGAHYQEASMTVLEERVHRLEVKVAALSDALRALTRGLEGRPLAEPGERSVGDAARRAHELLLTADLAQSERKPGPGSAEPGSPGSGSAAAPADGPGSNGPDLRV